MFFPFYVFFLPLCLSFSSISPLALHIFFAPSHAPTHLSLFSSLSCLWTDLSDLFAFAFAPPTASFCFLSSQRNLHQYGSVSCDFLYAPKGTLHIQCGNIHRYAWCRLQAYSYEEIFFQFKMIIDECRWRSRSISARVVVACMVFGRCYLSLSIVRGHRTFCVYVFSL